ncbi:adaptor protein MecA [Lachnoclostridium sp.]|uniref:adaptor protein MecA n=2 Tax=Lachnoclostridium sp. TaxID=2028282 RepID=UPI0028988E28|nr:adaptor protein MecA [Lachnoclostridium sp.]
MEFKRIDDETVRCIINEDDMKEYNIEIDDFLKNKGKIQEFLHKIVEMAVDEVGYNPKNGLLAMQVMPLPRNRLAITFSEKGAEGMEDILHQINDALGGNGEFTPESMMSRYEDLSSIEKVEAFDKFIRNLIQDVTDEYEEQQYKKKKDENKNKEDKKGKHKQTVDSTLQLYTFATLTDVERFCVILPESWAIRSTLFKDEKEQLFYMALEKGRLSKVNFQFVCDRANEYGKFHSENQARVAYLKEHASCLIDKKAIKVMRNIANG